MKRRTHKITAMALAAAMVLGMAPMLGFSARADEQEAQLSDISDGDIVIIDGVRFKVLDADHTNTNAAGMFVITEDVVDENGVKFNNATSDGNAYQGSVVKAYVDNYFNSTFSNDAKAAVIATSKSDGEYISSDKNLTFNAVDSILSNDKMFLLSVEEVHTYFGSELTARIAKRNGSAVYWLLRSPDASYTYYAGVVNPSGQVGDTYLNYSNGVRPAMNIDLSRIEEVYEVNEGEFRLVFAAATASSTWNGSSGQVSTELEIVIQPAQIDVTVPIAIDVVIDADRDILFPENVMVSSDSRMPLNLSVIAEPDNDNVNALTLVAPDKFTDNQWDNLGHAQTLANLALNIGSTIDDNARVSQDMITDEDNDDANQKFEMGMLSYVAKNADPSIALLDFSAKYGKTWGNVSDYSFTINLTFTISAP